MYFFSSSFFNLKSPEPRTNSPNYSEFRAIESSLLGSQRSLTKTTSSLIKYESDFTILPHPSLYTLKNQILQQICYTEIHYEHHNKFSLRKSSTTDNNRKQWTRTRKSTTPQTKNKQKHIYTKGLLPGCAWLPLMRRKTANQTKKMKTPVPITPNLVLYWKIKKNKYYYGDGNIKKDT